MFRVAHTKTRGCGVMLTELSVHDGGVRVVFKDSKEHTVGFTDFAAHGITEIVCADAFHSEHAFSEHGNMILRTVAVLVLERSGKHRGLFNVTTWAGKTATAKKLRDYQESRRCDQVNRVVCGCNYAHFLKEDGTVAFSF